MAELTFLGTGGGRFATIFQTRATGGIYLRDGNTRIHIDPGPGALVKAHEAKIDPTQTDAVLVSHCHPDHYTDAEIMIEAMTQGGHKRRGVVIGSKSVLEGAQNFEAGVSKYHLQKVASVICMAPGDATTVNDMRIEAALADHNDPSAIGFRFHTKRGIISDVCDTALSDEVINAYRGSRVLILPLTRPLGARIPKHLCTEDAVKFVDEVKPEIAILTHFGMRIVNEEPEVQAKIISDNTGIRSVAAKDGMRLSVEENIEIL